MSPQHTSSVGYAIHYNPGYLYVGALGAGSQGSVVLVQSVENGKACAYKRTSANFIPGAFPNREIELTPIHDHIPKLLYSEKHQVFEPGHHHRDSQAASMIYDYCNGGTLQRLMTFPDFKPSPLLLWKFFDQMLTILEAAHQGSSVGHQDSCPKNIFLHFPNVEDRLPEILLGDWGQAWQIDDDIWRENTWQIKRDDEIEDEDTHRENASIITTDLNGLSIVMAWMLTNHKFGENDVYSDPRFNLDEYEIEECPRDPDYPGELYGCYFRLQRMVDSLEGESWEEYDGFRQLCKDVKDNLQKEQARLQPDDVQDLRFLRETQQFHPDGFTQSNEPRIWNCREDLLDAISEIPGPFQIAKLDMVTKKVVCVEEPQFSLHNPGLDLMPWMCRQQEELLEHLAPTINDNMEDTEFWDAVQQADELDRTSQTTCSDAIRRGMLSKNEDGNDGIGIFLAMSDQGCDKLFQFHGNDRSWSIWTERQT